MTTEHIGLMSDEYAATSSLTLPINATRTKTQFRRPCVLIVEDYSLTRELYRMILEGACFEVVEATDGVEALLRLRDTTPDLILMDLSMPLMDGWEATRRLKSDSRTAGIPIVVLTASTSNETAARAKRAGCLALVTKPCMPADLVKTIRHCLSN
jgi:two-component system cell cycle response regulator DivK